MSDFGVEQDMTRASMMDQKIETLLSGTADMSDPLVAKLAVMQQSISEAFPLPVIAEDVEDSHLARMMAALVPAAPVVVSQVPADRTSPLLATLKASFARRVAAVTLALSTAFGGAAYAGVLPDPVQRAVSKAAAVVGLDLPGVEDDTLAEDRPEQDGRDSERGPLGEGSDDEADDRSGASNGDESEEPRTGERDDARDDAEDEAEDRRDDSADQDDQQDEAEDRRDDERDEQEDAADEREDEADESRDEAEDREDDETDEREDEEDDTEDAFEDAEDEADDSRDHLEDIEGENRGNGDGLNDGDDDDRESESGSGDQDESDD